jgi:hypothetical protein
MRAEEVVVILILSVGAVIFYSLLLRYRRRELQHKERLAALEKGTSLPDLFEDYLSPRSGRIYLLRGMIWLFSGIAIVTFLSAIAGYTRQPASMERRLERTQDLKRLGATDEQIQEAEKEPPRDAMPWGVPLLGLVPMGIGLAYLIYYQVEKKNSGAMAPG